MSEYEQKREARIERMKSRAARLARAADAAHARSAELAEFIPMGQPILVGHHSQRKHERDIERIQGGYERSARLRAESQALLRRAAVAESRRAISSDDPEAIEKLRAKLAKIEADRARMVAANKAVRSKSAREGLVALGFSEGAIAQILTPDFAGRVGFPDYALRNASSEAARLRKRIAELEAKAAGPTHEAVEVAGVRIEEKDNRVRIIFPDRPSEGLRGALKASGFRWAPSVGAWQRHASEAAWCAAKRIVSTSERGAA